MRCLRSGNSYRCGEGIPAPRGAYLTAEAFPGLTPTMWWKELALSTEFFLPKKQRLEYIETISRDRLSTYLKAAQGDSVVALRIYSWNTAVNSAFYGPLQELEVALRNSIDRVLSKQFGSEWFDCQKAGLNGHARGQIAIAKSALARNQHNYEKSQIVATLSFGFWVSLLDTGQKDRQSNKNKQYSGKPANYEMTLWRPALRNTFPYCKKLKRQHAYRPFFELLTLRNRIAHHEPVFKRDLRDDFFKYSQGSQVDFAGNIGMDRAALSRRRSAGKKGYVVEILAE